MKKKTYATRVYHYLNRVYFDDVLPPVKFKFVNDATFGGMAVSDGETFFHIIFSTAFHYDYVEIMLHEMCHIFQFVTGGKDQHGKTFKEIALDISQRSGYYIQKHQEMEWR
ncbi:MAG: hypothetical protein GWN62_11785 [Aliifodinibius sp.]|nr:hypothetical protein [Fodinibius sp.]